MTAIAMVRCSEGIVLASDGAGYDTETGRMASRMPKVALLPDLSCILACQGAGMTAEFAHVHLRMMAASGKVMDGFDDVLAALPGIMRTIEAEDLPATTRDAEFRMLVGGYSERRERWETYLIHNSPQLRTAWPPDQGGTFYMAHPIGAAYFLPEPDADSARRVVLNLSALETGDYDPVQTAVRAVCAARFMRGIKVNGEMAPHVGVGGYLQLSILNRGSVSSASVHEWPDERGEFIAPLDDDLPAFARPLDSS